MMTVFLLLLLLLLPCLAFRPPPPWAFDLFFSPNLLVLA